MDPPVPDPIGDLKWIVESCNRPGIRKIIGNAHMKAHSDKLQIITLEENLSWERMQHAKVIARKETIDELTREVQDQRQRMSQYEAKIQELEAKLYEERQKNDEHVLRLAKVMGAFVRGG
ncbi:hypothetical protein NLI96_g4473 [Meripilus lineatus]|uniref:Uncharacterized protein n=1 Tax=Meripilus lineatus TaxID=2056292 RepID=A0AAD5YJW7_9APHY|nr:hypothetical protein NLI96_g4473 [Physisporinus lineatus]